MSKQTTQVHGYRDNNNKVAAIEFYLKNGFYILQRLHNFYHIKSKYYDAYEMAFDLPSEIYEEGDMVKYMNKVQHQKRPMKNINLKILVVGTIFGMFLFYYIAYT
eukprot:TRINITY_DN457_c0_g1_i4.p2 TRINITY_DN457_c0_g1~~TRINITY_DN457_c0_g1_i4.p2  ORF type:complete len:105 (-),score=8.98 TRINITY_DN457_c0_g1_i4:35-349(-)